MWEECLWHLCLGKTKSSIEVRGGGGGDIGDGVVGDSGRLVAEVSWWQS